MENPRIPPKNLEINQVFEDIVFSETKIAEEAFADGLLKGIRDGEEKGHRLGFMKGVEFGAEVGYYQGVTKTLFKMLDTDPACVSNKSIAVLHKLRSALASMPTTNCPDTDIINLLEKVRSCYKQLCSLLKLDLALDVDELSF